MKKLKQKFLPVRGSESRISASGSSLIPGTLLPVPESESQLQALKGAPSPSSLSSTVSGPYGLKKLYEGTEPVVDIVAVHGLNGHRETTWTDEGGVLWLRDLLPSRIPDMRVWTWGYDSRTHTNSHHDHLTIKKLYDHGRELVQELDGERRTDGSYQRPIIFVAHSLGGIVVKNALLHSDRVRQGHLEDERSIKLSTYGIMFMGTPHQGGQGVKIGEVLLHLAKVRGNTNDGLLKHLEEHSELLQTQNSEFTAISQDFDVKFVYETLPTPIAGGVAKVIVPKWSAVVPGTPDAAEFGISQDHRRMTKISSGEGQDFRKLSRALESMIQKANAKIQTNWLSEGRMKQGIQAYDIPFNIRGVPVVGRYVERLREMQTMVKILEPGVENKQRRIFVLHGLGGIGKTQLALAYARKYQHKYTAVCWLNGQTRESLEQSIAGIASQLPKDQISDFAKSCAQQGNEQLGKVVHEVKSWFSRDGNRNWLLLYDNVDRDNSETSDDPEAFDVSEYLPECDQGSIIITTRQRRLRTLGDEMPLAKMTVEEGLDLLASRIGKSFRDDSQAYKLVARVGSLPLSLAQAASYMRETNTSMTEYLEFYNTAWDDLTTYEARPESTLHEYGNRSVRTTWAISFEGVKRKNEDAAKLLQVWSYLDNRDIWFGLFNNERNSDLEAWSNPPEWFRRVVRDKLSFKGVAATLLAYSLIEARQDSESYGMHPVVHEWCRKTITADRQPELAFLAITSVGSGAPHPNEIVSSPIRRRFLPHAKFVSQHVMDSLEETLGSEQAIDLYCACEKLGSLIAGGGTRMWLEAEALYCRAVSGYEKFFGLHHDSTLSALANLAELYADNKKRVDAEVLHRRILAIRTEDLGLNHFDTIETTVHLAMVLTDTNKLAEAESLFQSLLMRAPMSSGFLKSIVLACLGSLYKNQGKLTDSEAMYLQAIAEYKTEPETDQMEILQESFLGDLYHEADRLVEAEATTHQVVERMKKVLGLEDEETLQALHSLGTVIQEQGKFAEAEAVFQQALAGYRLVLDPEHELSLLTLHNLARCYMRQDRFTKAEPLLLEHLESFRQVPDDQKTSKELYLIYALGYTYMQQGRLAESEAKIQQALTGYQLMFGSEHKRTLSALRNLAHCYMKQGRLAEAETFFQQALLGHRRVLGLEHESTLYALRGLRYCYKRQGKFAEAAALSLQELESCKQIPDDQRTSTQLDAIYDLGYIYLKSGRLAESEAMFQQALTGYRLVLGLEHKSTLRTLRNLRVCYERQGKFAEAAALSPEDTDIERLRSHDPTTNVKSARTITKRIKHSLLRRHS